MLIFVPLVVAAYCPIYIEKQKQVHNVLQQKHFMYIYARLSPSQPTHIHTHSNKHTSSNTQSASPIHTFMHTSKCQQLINKNKKRNPPTPVSDLQSAKHIASGSLTSTVAVSRKMQIDSFLITRVVQVIRGAGRIGLQGTHQRCVIWARVQGAKLC